MPQSETPAVLYSHTCGLSWLALAYHRECSPSFANSTTACGHACGWMMASARICSIWSRVLGKVCTRATAVQHFFFTAVLRVAEKTFTADAVIMDSMVVRRRKGEKRRGGHGPEESTGSRRRRRPRRCGECRTLTMQALYRDHQKGWRR